MKKKAIEEQILLEQAGELKGRRARRLALDIEQAPEKMAYRADLEQLTSLVRNHPPSEEVSDLTLHRIRTAAQQALQPAGRARGEVAHLTWRPALAYAAAALLLLAGGMLAIRSFQGQADVQTAHEESMPAVLDDLISGDELDHEIEALDAMLAMSYSEVAGNGMASESDDEIARELIELEGIEI